ncbi:hypothetical protein ETB97_010616 [Aspergillus alliaceus]|uniref:Uncharacterized protein n=1 Tax=Petromyces alliaceus TaxID=209559 RepID=A0A8H5ZV92_PETAA|nr:hypothetical protein ETB97_010616 [Aspergillus burnettii]
MHYLLWIATLLSAAQALPRIGVRQSDQITPDLQQRFNKWMDEHSWENIQHLPPSDSRPHYPTDDSVDTIDPTGKGYAAATDPLPEEFDQHADELLKAYEASRQTNPKQESEKGGPKAPGTDLNTSASPTDAESAMNLLTGPTRESYNNLMGQFSERPSQAQTSNDIKVGNGQAKEGVPSDMAAYNQIVNQPNSAYDSLRQTFNDGKYVHGVDGFDSSGSPIIGDQGNYDAALWG